MREEVRVTYDKIAASYDRLYADRPETAGEDQLVGDWLKKRLPRTATILDVGSGTGGFLDRVGWPRATYRGIDISPKMVQQASEKHPGYRFDVGDADEPWSWWLHDWRGDTPRVVVALWSLYYIAPAATCIQRFAASGADRLMAVLRTPLDPAPSSVDYGSPLYYAPWTIRETIAAAEAANLGVPAVMPFSYGGDVVPAELAHYFCFEATR